MASVYKRKGSKKWVVAWSDENGVRRTKSSGTTDHAAATRIAKKLEAEASLRRAGVVDSKLDAINKNSQKPISEHLAQFVISLRAKRTSEVHQSETESKIEGVCAFCKWTKLSDVSADGMNRFVDDLQGRGRSSRTLGAYIQAMKTFTRWAVKTGRLSADPLASISKPSPEVDRRLVRRNLSHEEYSWLNAVTRQGEESYGLSGRERALLYTTAIQTGLRASELRSLTRGKLKLDQRPPFVVVEACKTKNGKAARQYIQSNLATELQELLKGRLPGVPVFNMPAKCRLARMFKKDLEVARAAWLASIENAERRQEAEAGDFLRVVNSEGESLDFHALRHTTASWLIHTGADIKTVQVVMRHSDINLTVNRYGHLFPGAEADAVGRMQELFEEGVKPEVLEHIRLQRLCQQSGCETVRNGSTQCDESEVDLAGKEVDSTKEKTGKSQKREGK